MSPESALTILGFTDLESRLYCEVLRVSPITAYRLSQIVGKAPTNTYQALASLAQKGAVLVRESEGAAKSYSPVPPDELIAGLENNFLHRKKTALDLLSNLLAPTKGEHVYQLQTASQAIARAHAMFESAKEIVLFDFFPSIFTLMESSIRAAQNRGILVAGIAYDAAHEAETIPFNKQAGAVIADLWPGLGLIVIADGEQQLMAQLSKDQAELMNGVWSDSAFLSATYHSALAAEIRLTAMSQDPSDPLKYISLFRSKPIGLRKVLAS